MQGKKPCVRCLLEEAGKQDVYSIIQKRVSEIPEPLRTDDELYSERLAVCKGCEALSGGTCTKCGCYAELRAARADSYCPHEKRMW